MVTNRKKKQTGGGTDGSATEQGWYLALHKLHIAQGPGVKPSTIRIFPGQRFDLDGTEFVDVESLLRMNAIKVYEESDREWAEARMAERPEQPKRRDRG